MREPLSPPPEPETPPAYPERQASWVEQTAGQPVDSSEPQTAPPALEEDDPPPKPWLPLTLAIAGLFGTSSGMLYMGWVAVGYRGRYRRLLRYFIEAGHDPSDLEQDSGSPPEDSPPALSDRWDELGADEIRHGDDTGFDHEIDRHDMGR